MVLSTKAKDYLPTVPRELIFMAMVMQVSHKVQPHNIYLYFDIKKTIVVSGKGNNMNQGSNRDALPSKESHKVSAFALDPSRS